jgi:Methyltransferase domain
MVNDREAQISKFFDTVGWQMNEGVTEVAQRWEDLRQHVQPYVSKCRLRVLQYLPDGGGNLLDVGSGPIQFEEYLEYSRNFGKRYCVDLSEKALDGAKSKLGDRGVYWLGSIMDMPLEENFFDCTISIKALFNIDKDRQEEVVRKMIRTTRPGRPVIISYANPHPMFLLRWLRKRRQRHNRSKGTEGVTGGARLGSQYQLHHIEWWDRFNDVTSVELRPFYALNPDLQKIVIPNNKLGAKVLDVLFNAEERFPRFFVNNFVGILVILRKH